MSDLNTGPDGLVRPAWATTTTLMREYYDTEWGVPVTGEADVFERIVLESFEVGLSWATILRKRPAFREAFHHFDPDVVAAYGPDDVERLMDDERIIRNRGKIEATIQGAKSTIALRSEGGLANFVWSFQPEYTLMPTTFSELPKDTPESSALAKALKSKGFNYVGPVNMLALMEAIGIIDTHLVGSHRRGSSGLFTKEGRAKHRGVPPKSKGGVS